MDTDEARTVLLARMTSLVQAEVDDVAYAQPLSPPGGVYQSHAIPRFTVVESGRKHIAYHDGAQSCARHLPARTAIFMPPYGWTQPRYDSPRTMVGVVFHQEYTRYLWSTHDGKRPPHGADAFVHVPVTMQGSAAHLLQTLCLRAMESRGRPTTAIDVDLFMALLRVAHENLEQAPTGPSSRARATWESIREYVIENFHRPISRDSTATVFRLHPNYVSTLFAQQGGETFARFLVRLRLERAAEMLRCGTHSLAEVARACGYHDSGYFIKAYRQHHGITPGRVRRDGFQNDSRRAEVSRRPVTSSPRDSSREIR